MTDIRALVGEVKEIESRLAKGFRLWDKMQILTRQIMPSREFSDEAKAVVRKRFLELAVKHTTDSELVQFPKERPTKKSTDQGITSICASHNSHNNEAAENIQLTKQTVKGQ